MQSKRKAICDAYDLKLDEILFMDDYWMNCCAAADADFQVCTPMEVVNFMNEKNTMSEHCRNGE